MKCPHCGAEITADDIFCGDCGVRLIPPNRPEDIHLAQTMIAEAPQLIVIAGSSRIEKCILKGRTTIGRDTDNEIMLRDLKVSRHHAVIETSQQGWIIDDQNSANGTYINGTRIGHPQLLRHGDEIAMGGIRMIFSHSVEMPGPAVGPPPLTPLAPVQETSGARKAAPFWLWILAALVVIGLGAALGLGGWWVLRNRQISPLPVMTPLHLSEPTPTPKATTPASQIETDANPAWRLFVHHPASFCPLATTAQTLTIIPFLEFIKIL
jgi:hypothetical protein